MTTMWGSLLLPFLQCCSVDVLANSEIDEEMEQRWSIKHLDNLFEQLAVQLALLFFHICIKNGPFGKHSQEVEFSDLN